MIFIEFRLSRRYSVDFTTQSADRSTLFLLRLGRLVELAFGLYQLMLG